MAMVLRGGSVSGKTLVLLRLVAKVLTFNSLRMHIRYVTLQIILAYIGFFFFFFVYLLKFHTNCFIELCCPLGIK